LHLQKIESGDALFGLAGQMKGRSASSIGVDGWRLMVGCRSMRKMSRFRKCCRGIQIGKNYKRLSFVTRPPPVTGACEQVTANFSRRRFTDRGEESKVEQVL